MFCWRSLSGELLEGQTALALLLSAPHLGVPAGRLLP
jgi:hypothetical protein